MKNFFKEYWPWIVVPMVLIFGALALLLIFSRDDSATPFVYNVF